MVIDEAPPRNPPRCRLRRKAVLNSDVTQPRCLKKPPSSVVVIDADQVRRDLLVGNEVGVLGTDDELHDLGLPWGTLGVGAFRDLDAVDERLAGDELLDRRRRLHDATAVDADLAVQIQVLEIRVVDVGLDLGAELTLQNEALQRRHQSWRHAGEQLGARELGDVQRQLEAGKEAQLGAVGKGEGARRQLDEAADGSDQIVQAALEAIEGDPPRLGERGPADDQPQIQVPDRLGREALVFDAEPVDLHVAAEADRAVGPADVERGIDVGPFGIEDVLRQDLRDLA